MWWNSFLNHFSSPCFWYTMRLVLSNKIKTSLNGSFQTTWNRHDINTPQATIDSVCLYNIGKFWWINNTALGQWIPPLRDISLPRQRGWVVQVDSVAQVEVVSDLVAGRIAAAIWDRNAALQRTVVINVLDHHFTCYTIQTWVVRYGVLESIFGI